MTGHRLQSKLTNALTTLCASRTGTYSSERMVSSWYVRCTMKSISIDSGIVPPIVCMPTGISDWLEIGGITGMMTAARYFFIQLLQFHTNVCLLAPNTHTHTHTFNGPFSGTTQVSRYKKGKTNLDFTEARDSGSGNSWAICKSAPRSRQ